MLGFFAKFEVLRAAINADLIYLAIMGVLASVIGAFLLFENSLLNLFWRNAEAPLDNSKTPILKTVWTVSAVLMVFGVVSLFGVEEMAKAAASSLLN